MIFLLLMISNFNLTLLPRKPRQKNKFWWLRHFRYLYIRLLRLRGTPKAIARGLALGVFSGCFPLFGLQIIIAIILAAIFKANKLAAIIGTWVSNPFTYVPLFLFNYRVGTLLLRQDTLSLTQIQFDSWTQLKTYSLDLTITLFFGCFIVGCFASIFTYIISLRLVSRWRKLRRLS